MEGRSSKPPENVTGPVWPHAERFAQDLANRGYARNTIDHQMWLAARLSRWMDREHLALVDLSSSELERFERWRWERGGLRRKCSLEPIIRYLRASGEIPEVDETTVIGPVEELIERYRRHLATERGAAPTTLVKYEHVARLFLQQQSLPTGDYQVPDGSAVSRFIAQASRDCGVGAAKNRVKGLRSLLRFMHLEGITPDLVDAVPTVAGWKHSQLPKGLESEQVARLLASCPDTVAGRRDRAVMVLMARLGLRAGEVAALEMGDFDWVRGEVEIPGKGGRRERLPLPEDVGEAVAAYVLGGRPNCTTGPLFHRVQAPAGRLSVHSVKEVVRRACRRAGIPSSGPHRLRHGLATQVLSEGGSLIEVGQVLRHRELSTTAIYAKVDRRQLRDLARPWPEIFA